MSESVNALRTLNGSTVIRCHWRSRTNSRVNTAADEIWSGEKSVKVQTCEMSKNLPNWTRRSECILSEVVNRNNSLWGAFCGLWTRHFSHFQANFHTETQSTIWGLLEWKTLPQPTALLTDSFNVRGLRLFLNSRPRPGSRDCCCQIPEMNAVGKWNAKWILWNWSTVLVKTKVVDTRLLI